jgi:hypothetical protein
VQADKATDRIRSAKTDRRKGKGDLMVILIVGLFSDSETQLSELLSPGDRGMPIPDSRPRIGGPAEPQTAA